MAESRKQKAESRKQKDSSSRGFECQETSDNSGCKLYNGKGKQGNFQRTKHWNRCCYCNYKRVFKADVKIAMAILARDYKGFGSGLIPSNGVIVETI